MFGFYDDPTSLYGDPTDDPGMGTFDSLALGGGRAPLSPHPTPLRQPPPKRITAEELAAFLDRAGAEPSKPTPLTSIGQLSGDDLRQARLGSLWAGLSALGTGISGHWDRAAADGLPAIQAAQDQVISRANTRNYVSWENAKTEADNREHDRNIKAMAGGLTGYLNQIYDAEPPESPFVARAEIAARTGDMSALEKLAQAEPQRNYARSKGVNPDGPDAFATMQELQATLKGHLDALAMQQTNPVKTDQAAAEAKAVQDARLPGEMKLKLAPSYQAPTQYEPLSRIAARTELVQGIEDKHAALREAAKQGTSIPGKLGQAPSGEWGWITPPTKDNPAPTFTPIDGQPKKAGGLQHFQKDGTPYVWNPSKPELGAIEVSVHQAGDKGAPTMQDLTAPPPRPAPNLGMGGQGLSRRPLPGVSAPAAPAAPPASAHDATKKLSAIADAGIQKRIAAGRAYGYSDSEIASFLGIH